MIFKAYDRHIKKIALHHNVSNKAAFSLLSAHIYKLQPFDHSLISFIIISKELIPSTDCDHNSIIFHIRLEILLDFLQLFTYQHLFSVGATAKKYDIQFGKIDSVIQFVGYGFCLDSSPETALHQTLDISSVTVKVQKIRI